MLLRTGARLPGRNLRSRLLSRRPYLTHIISKLTNPQLAQLRSSIIIDNDEITAQRELYASHKREQFGNDAGVPSRLGVSRPFSKEQRFSNAMNELDQLVESW